MVSPGELLVELDAESERKRLEEATVQLAAIGPELDALRRALVAEEQAITSDRGATAIALDQVPARLLASWSQGFAAVEAGGLLKQRLLAGAVELSPDVVRDQGAGQLLG